MEKEIWFRRKTYGWGWFPANGKGWAVTLLFVLLAIVPAFFAFCIYHLVAPYFLYAMGLNFTFLWICWKKGERPQWQWGKKKE